MEHHNETVYVIGHQNPDADSVISAIAYASLRNALGDRGYVPVVLGEVNDQTAAILRRFHAEAPQRLYTVRTQVRDLKYDTPPILSSAVSVGHAWRTLQEGTMPALPVADEDGYLFGMLTKGDIAEFLLETLEFAGEQEIPLFNLLNMLDGTLLNDPASDTVRFTGIIIALPDQDTNQESFENALVICGSSESTLRRAAEQHAACIVMSRAHPSEELLKALQDIPVINTVQSAYRASRTVYQAVPVSNICGGQELVSFRLDDYLDNVRESVLQSRYRSFPILDAEGRVAGILSRNNIMRPERKKVVLVDHNEAAQSVPGLEQAEILEIIDHHRLADIQTAAPMYFRNEPVGSTATIVAELYQEKGIAPSPKMAGLLAAGILSDTVLFRSPTCTQQDERIARRMERISGVSLDELGREMFAVTASAASDPKEMLHSDFKEFHIAGHVLGIGQVTCLDSASVLEHADAFLRCMREEAAEKHYDMLLLMVTDVLRNGTELLVVGDNQVIRQAYGAEVEADRTFLPGVLSRKKQIVPALSLIWG